MNYAIYLHLSTSQGIKFENIQSRAKTIIQNEEENRSWKTVEHSRKCSLEVFKSINNIAPPVFHNYV